MKSKTLALIAILVALIGTGILAIVSANGTSVSMNSAILEETETAVVQKAMNSPEVKNPRVEPMLIPEDTDKVPLWGETAELMIDVTDDSAIDSVIIDLPPLVGKSITYMGNKGNYSVDSVLWCICNYSTNASVGSAIFEGGSYVPYQLQVNATDIYGQSNTSVYVNLTVAKNGDVTYNGVSNLGDGIYLVNWALHVPGYDIPSERLVLADVDGNGDVNLGDGIYLVNWALHVPGYDVLH